jgi:hypothetical protein
MRDIGKKEWARKEELQKKLEDLLREISEAGMELHLHHSKEQAEFVTRFFKGLLEDEGGTLSYGGIEKELPLRLRVSFSSSHSTKFTSEIHEAFVKERALVSALKQTAKEKP